MHGSWEKDARQLLERLERHWRPHYDTDELRQRLQTSLRAVKRALARDSADARLVVYTWRRVLRHEARRHEVDEANKALIRFLKSMGVAVVGILPLGFITLPALFGLARHFGIELLPEGDGPVSEAVEHNS